jgi:hypothetical protein
METNLPILIVLGIILILSGAWLVNSIIVLTKLKIEEDKRNKLYAQLQEENNKSIADYSEKLLEFIRMLTTQISVLKFRTFVDNHEMDKITKANIQKLVAEVAESVNTSINSTNIDFDDILFTKEFYENYIVETSLITIKNLLNKTINDEEN